MRKHLLLITLLTSLFWTAQAQGIRIGDIMCVSGNDTTYVHPDEYVSGALAVVFYLDESGEHGWAIALRDEPGHPAWSPWGDNVPGLIDYGHPRKKPGVWPGDDKGAIYDMEGYHNTMVIRQYGSYSDFPAARTVDFAHGWYLPAIGQLNYANLYLTEITEALEVVGGQTFEPDGARWYWSSTEFADPSGSAPCAWSHKFSLNFMCPMTKSRTTEENKLMTVRAVRSF